MLMDMLATLSAGFGGAGVALALRWLVQRAGLSAPRWIVPAFAGGAMIAYSVWSEYSWFDRVSAALPEGVRVVLPIPEGAPWRPWSYIVPVATRFVALDMRAPVTHPGQPGQVVMPVLFVARWQPLRSLPVAFDCAGGRRADIVQGGVMAPDGTIPGVTWQAVPPGDPIFAAACDGG